MADGDPDSEEAGTEGGSLSGFIDAPLSAAAKKLRLNPELIAAYDNAHAEVLARFVSKKLFTSSGDLVTDLNSAHTMADLAGRDAAQAIKKNPPLVWRRSAQAWAEGEHPLDLKPLDD